jgi:hypothetical protein
MRKKPKNEATSEVVISLAELAKMVLELQDRVKTLEGEASGNGPFLPLVLGHQRSEPAMGRKAKLSPEELIGRRDRLSWWIESHWPHLSRRLLNPKNAKYAAYAFVKAKQALGGVFLPPFYDDPERFTDELWLFLRSKWFGNNPRNLAGAMAGLPELSWKRSLDIAQQSPISIPLHAHAWRDHLRRRFPLRFKELRRATTPKEVKAILARTTTSDITYCHMKKHPAEVLRDVFGRPVVNEVSVVLWPSGRSGDYK